MADSERPDQGTWPQADRRGRVERRQVRERRASRTAPPPRGQTDGWQSGERRGGPDRRQGTAAWQPLPFETDVLTTFAPEQGLLAAATRAREFAQARYSKFKVGAALETAAGTIVTGCNVENATYGLTLCAERVALVKALSEGHTAFTRLAIVAETELPTAPCGACRQLLWEYCGDIDVFLGNPRALTGHYRLQSLLPLPFDRRLLE